MSAVRKKEEKKGNVEKKDFNTALAKLPSKKHVKEEPFHLLQQQIPDPVPIPINDQTSSLSSIREVHQSGKRVKNQTESESDTNNYNSKKYIEYLDGDVFPDDSSQSSTHKIRNAFGTVTISAKKQEMLLQALYSKPVRLPEYGHCTSLSLGQIE